jgi:hypothetical protein
MLRQEFCHHLLIQVTSCSGLPDQALAALLGALVLLIMLVLASFLVVLSSWEDHNLTQK